MLSSMITVKKLHKNFLPFIVVPPILKFLID